MRTTPRITLRRRVWDEGRPSAVPGIEIANSRHEIFVSSDQLGALIDFATKAARHYERKEQQQ